MSRIAPKCKKEKKKRRECCIRIESTICTSWNPLSFSCEDDQISRGLNADWFWLDDRGRINLDWASICASASRRLCILLYRLINPPNETERQSLSMIRHKGIFPAISVCCGRQRLPPTLGALTVAPSFEVMMYGVFKGFGRRQRWRSVSKRGTGFMATRFV